MNRYMNVVLQNIKNAAKKFNQIKGKLSLSFTGNIIFALSQWGIITILARMSIGTDLGDYSLALALASPIIVFFNFNLRGILATDSNNDYDFNEYLGSRIIHMIIAYILLIIIVFIYTNNKEIIIITLLIGLFKFVESLSDIVFGYFQKLNLINLIGKSQIYRGFYSVLFFSISYYLFQNLKLSIILLVIIMLLRFLFYDLRKLRKIINVKPIINKSSLNLIKLAYPLGVSALLSSLIVNGPRYFLEFYAGIISLGVFSALYYIVVATDMAIKPITLLAGPHLAKVFNNERSRFINEIIKFIVLSIIIFIIILLPVLFMGEKILLTFYGSKYIQYVLEFKILFLSILFSFINSFLNIGLIAMRFLKSQAIISVFTLIITFIISMSFIPSYGLLGATIVVLISRAVQTILFITIIIISFYKKT